MRNKKKILKKYYHGKTTRYDLKIVTFLGALYIIRQNLKEMRHLILPVGLDHATTITPKRSKGAHSRLQHDLPVAIRRRLHHFQLLKLRRRRFFSPELTEERPRTSQGHGNLGDDSGVGMFIFFSCRNLGILLVVWWCVKGPRRRKVSYEGGGEVIGGGLWRSNVELQLFVNVVFQGVN